MVLVQALLLETLGEFVMSYMRHDSERPFGLPIRKLTATVCFMIVAVALFGCKQGQDVRIHSEKKFSLPQNAPDLAGTYLRLDTQGEYVLKHQGFNVFEFIGPTQKLDANDLAELRETLGVEGYKSFEEGVKKAQKSGPSEELELSAQEVDKIVEWINGGTISSRDRLLFSAAKLDQDFIVFHALKELEQRIQFIDLFSTNVKVSDVLLGHYAGGNELVLFDIVPCLKEDFRNEYGKRLKFNSSKAITKGTWQDLKQFLLSCASKIKLDPAVQVLKIQ
ncbi:hypothetical protein EOI86_07260 [Hwanghaeella grinnelliae]|uniref:Uncharacterized protein n=1 Tax=Hwanghaeella grinnelliae TaxID=2500179 RepID=A0A3S2Y5I9_9PROT|nr:hypothetical protein [Hwanghaeella grinnelliae]RVU39047.1 hypothetical protein EOI86_07260 [Hwanghaeella grinnelliae]